MNVDDIPKPALAAIKVAKDGKMAIFETKIIQTTDNKYIYTLPVRVKRKLVNFDVKGLIKEIRVEFAPGEYYVWKNISIGQFIEDGRRYLKIKTTTPGIRTKEFTEKKNKDSKKVIENSQKQQKEVEKE